MNKQIKKGLLLAGMALSLGLAAGCSDSDNVAVGSYTVTVTNATGGQPLAPLAVVLHGDAYSPWSEGTAAGSGLEQLAEGGDPTAFLAEAAADGAVRDFSNGMGLIMPGANESVMVSGPVRGLRLSVATMLGATNDAFTGVNGADISGLAPGESTSWETVVYDAGTEADTETAATVPALMGEGYNAVRDDAADIVTVHAGVVTADDGLATSGLNQSHRFVGPAAVVTVTRM